MCADGYDAFFNCRGFLHGLWWWGRFVPTYLVASVSDVRASAPGRITEKAQTGVQLIKVVDLNSQSTLLRVSSVYFLWLCFYLRSLR